MFNNYYKNYFTKAWMETRAFFGWDSKTFWFVGLYIFLGAPLYVSYIGWDAMFATTVGTIFTVIIPAAFAFGILFGYNLILAPPRLHKELESKVKELEENNDPALKFDGIEISRTTSMEADTTFATREDFYVARVINTSKTTTFEDIQVFLILDYESSVHQKGIRFPLHISSNQSFKGNYITKFNLHPDEIKLIDILKIDQEIKYESGTINEIGVNKGYIYYQLIENTKFEKIFLRECDITIQIVAKNHQAVKKKCGIRKNESEIFELEVSAPNKNKVDKGANH